jgi:hypothetical protein
MLFVALGKYLEGIGKAIVKLNYRVNVFLIFDIILIFCNKRKFLSSLVIEICSRGILVGEF